MNRANLWNASLVMVVLAAVACGQEEKPRPQQEHKVVSRKDALSERKALILGSTVTGGLNSPEAIAAQNFGLPVDLVTDAQWSAMTAEQFASYQLIILGDASCAGLNAVSAALANRHIWGPAINGSVIIEGTAAVANGAPQEMFDNAIRFAAYESGNTGLYVSLSCYYQNAAPNTHVALLEPFGDFSVQGGGCTQNPHIVASDPDLDSISEEMISNWSCSVGTQFDSFPMANFSPWAIATYPNDPGFTSAQGARDFADGTFGAPYILTRGSLLNGCGNYEVDVGEGCDNGLESNGRPGKECSSTCQLNWCGNGKLDPGEDCDEGWNNGTSLTACPRSCRRLPAPPPSNHPPVAICKQLRLSAGPTCGGVGASIDNGSSDPDGDAVNCVQSAASFEVGTTQVTLTCTDSKGLTGSCTGSVTVEDDVAPSITCPAASTFECGVASAPMNPPQAQDNCTTPTVTYSMAGESFTVGAARELTWKASDGVNEATCSTSVTMVDTLAPSLALKGAAQQQLECGASLYTELGAAATDACAGDLSSRVAVAGTVDTHAVGTYPLSYSVSDPAGHSVSAVRVVKVADTVAPALALNGAGAVAVECGVGAYTESGATASDACAGDLSNKVAISGAVNTAAVGSYPVSYSVADASGNAASAVRTVSVNDTLPPSLALVGASAMKLECGVDSFANPGAMASDACSGDLTSSVVSSGTVNTAVVGSYPVSYSVADAAGHSVSAVRTVQVADTKAPALVLNGAGAVALECGAGQYTESGATASDACTGDLSSKVAISGAVNAAAVGSYPVNYSVADASGNGASAVRTVSVSDTKAPVVSLVGAPTLKLECGVDSFTNQGATATDLCSGDLTSAIVTSGSVNTAAVGSYPISYRATDAAGNSASATRTVQVADTKAPVLTLKGASSLALECGVGVYTEAGATAVDACAGDLSRNVAISGAVNAALRGAYSVSYSVADASGNVASAARVVSVNDTLAPVVSLVGAAAPKLECGVDSFVDAGATALDACSGILAPVKTGSVNTAAVGNYPLTYKATDAAGLVGSAVRTVQVADTKAPTLSLKGMSTMTLECGAATYTEPGATASDVCTGDLSSKVTTSGAVNTAVRGSYSVSYNVADASGNGVSAVRTVNVTDTKAPVISLVGAATMTVNRGSTFTDPGATATDLCAGNLTSVIVKTGSVNTSVVGTYTLTYKVTDAAGLSATVTRTVTVADACNTTVTVKPVQQIWPPNHNYQTFSLSDCAVVTTSCGTGGCHGGADIDDMGTILSIYSDEVEDSQGNGDGSTLNDIVITGPSTFKLRAEREGKGNGRVYGVRFKVTDSSGAVQTATCKFSVPHDQGDTSVVDNGAAAGYTVTSHY